MSNYRVYGNGRISYSATLPPSKETLIMAEEVQEKTMDTQNKEWRFEEAGFCTITYSFTDKEKYGSPICLVKIQLLKPEKEFKSLNVWLPPLSTKKYNIPKHGEFLLELQAQSYQIMLEDTQGHIHADKHFGLELYPDSTDSESNKMP